MMNVIREVPSDGVVLLRLNRPQALNALNLPMRSELAKWIVEADGDAATRVIVITGNEQAFAAGADVVEFKSRTVGDSAFHHARVAWTALENCRKPLIAAVNGFALGGGCELALHCDIIVVGESARLGQPEVKLGIMPGAGGTQRILRAAGRYAALRFLLTGDMIPAAKAVQMGIASEVVADADVLQHALKIAATIATSAPIAVAAIKEMVNLGADASLGAALALERKSFELLFATEDHSEGIAAFLEKRKPVFFGR
jgi:enoyl-CoA hydratase/carnithine racemase